MDLGPVLRPPKTAFAGEAGVVEAGHADPPPNASIGPNQLDPVVGRKREQLSVGRPGSVYCAFWKTKSPVGYPLVGSGCLGSTAAAEGAETEHGGEAGCQKGDERHLDSPTHHRIVVVGNCQNRRIMHPSRLAQGWQRLRRLGEQSLFRNSLYIMGTTVVTSLLGFAFWLIAARTLSATEVGRSAALISAMVFVSVLTNLGLGQGLVADGEHRPRLGGAGELGRRHCRGGAAADPDPGAEGRAPSGRLPAGPPRRGRRRLLAGDRLRLHRRAPGEALLHPQHP